MIKRERKDLIRREPCAVAVNNSKTVGVAVGAETEMRLATADEFADVAHIFGVWFGMMPAEQRIQFVMKTT